MGKIDFPTARMWLDTKPPELFPQPVGFRGFHPHVVERSHHWQLVGYLAGKVSSKQFHEHTLSDYTVLKLAEEFMPKDREDRDD